MHYPPYGYLVAIKLEAASDAAVMQAARDYTFTARRFIRGGHGRFDQVSVIGPAIAPMERLRGRTRFQVLFKSVDRAGMRQLVGMVLKELGFFEVNRNRHKNVRIAVDVDPVNML